MEEIGLVLQDPENQIIMDDVMQELVFGMGEFRIFTNRYATTAGGNGPYLQCRTSSEPKNYNVIRWAKTTIEFVVSPLIETEIVTFR